MRLKRHRLLPLTILPGILLGLLFFTFSCEDTPPEIEYTPIVAAHGFLGGGDTYANFFSWWRGGGVPEDRLYAFDYNSFSDDALILSSLDAFIDDVLARTGAERVHLMGHSKGGGIGYSYLSDPAQSAKVDRYVHIGSFTETGPAGSAQEVPTLNVWSSEDLVIDAPGEIPGAENAKIEGADHYEVATSPESFQAISSFLYGVNFSVAGAFAEVEIAGKVVSLGENGSPSNGNLDIYEVDPMTGQRGSASPVANFTISSDGLWGPLTVNTGSTYEFEVTAGGRKIHYFCEPFNADNNLVYLRTIPPPITLTGILLAGLPQDDEQSVVTVFSSNRAVINGRDNLTVNGYDLARPDIASAEQTTIAYFLYDDGDMSTSEAVDSTFAEFPFLSGVDIYFQTSTPETITLEYNGRTLNLPNLPSGTEGPVVAVFQ